MTKKELKLIEELQAKSLPAFEVGQFVLLNKKPKIPRKIEAIEWHYQNKDWIYIIEIFNENAKKYCFRPYWFERDLAKADCDNE